MTKKRILIIDDDMRQSRLLKMKLEATGNYEAKDASNGEEGLFVAGQFKPDLIFLDVCMPGTSGCDVALQIGADAGLKNIPVIFLTSLVSDQDVADGDLLRGGRLFLPKSASLEKVIACIERYTEKRAEVARPLPG